MNRSIRISAGSVEGVLGILVLSIAIPALAKDSKPPAQPDRPSIKLANGLTITGVPFDASQHHFVVSDPGSEQEAIRKGTHGRWLKVVEDPRYIIQQLRRGEPVRGPHAEEIARIEKTRSANDAASRLQNSAPSANKQAKQAEAAKAKNVQAEGRSKSAPNSPLLADLGPATKKGAANDDWSMGMLSSTGTAGAAGSITPNNYGVGYLYNPNTANCSYDFYAFVTGAYATGGNTQATIVGFNNLYSTCSGTAPSAYFAYQINDPNSPGNMLRAMSSPAISLDGTQIAFIASDDYGCGSCTGSSSLVVLKWASGNGTIASPMVLNASTDYVAYGAYAACTAPCYTTVPYNASAASSCNTGNANYAGPCNTGPANGPFEDLNYDQIFVGDNMSNLHHFTNVFGIYSSAGPQEDLANDFPAYLNDGTCTAQQLVISSPVYDAFSGEVFAGTSGGGGASACANVWAVETTQSYGGTGTNGLIDTESTPLYGCNGIVDSLQYDFGTDYLYSTSDSEPFTCNNRTHVCNYMDVVNQWDISSSGGLVPPTCCAAFGSVGPASWGIIGTGTRTGSSLTACTSTGMADVVWDGQFDNVFEEGGNSTGNYYILGNHYGPLRLYQVPVTTGALPSGNATTVTALTSGTGTTGYGSSVNAFCNGAGSACQIMSGVTTTGTDLIIFSVWDSTAPNCTTSTSHGCLLQYNVSNPTIADIVEVSYLDWVRSSTTPGAPTGGCEVDNSMSTAADDNWYCVSTDNAESCATNSVNSPCAIQWQQD